ncbi:MAG: AbrB/MazE/SpoVT family DNA-binding domain-containing protein [Nocardioidaceae bacterium]|nr:AbrB/MazE/SpoVT family DNA-binding domain-containing protein [Nocardioidaceae bacterium]
MPQATMTSKGQITVPKEVRDELGIVPGTKVDFVRVSDREYRLRPKNRSVEDLFGIIKYDGPPITLEDMERGIAEGAAESA